MSNIMQAAHDAIHGETRRSIPVPDNDILLWEGIAPRSFTFSSRKGFQSERDPTLDFALFEMADGEIHLS